MGNPWFETVAEAQRRADKRLPRSVSSALLAGSERGVTYANNVNAFSELGLAPHVADLKGARSIASSVMGIDLALPVILSPVGAQAIHPDAEVGEGVDVVRVCHPTFGAGQQCARHRAREPLVGPALGFGDCLEPWIPHYSSLICVEPAAVRI